MTNPRQGRLTRRSVLGVAGTTLIGCAAGRTIAAHGSKAHRIAVIGAGPSGLTAAHALNRLGYGSVTVFEAQDHVGGKVSSYAHDNHVFEMGAIAANEDYTTVLGIAHELGVEFRQFEQDLVILDSDQRHYRVDQFLDRHFSRADTVASFVRLQALTTKQPHLHHTNVGADTELHMPFSEYAKKYGLEPIADAFKSMIIGCGYGYYEDVPAIYIVKILKMMHSSAVRAGLGVLTGQTRPMLRIAPEGFEMLWRTVAARHDVRLGSAVSELVRRRRPDGTWQVLLTANGETHEYDCVIISASLDTAIKFIDASEEEENLFSRVQNYHYHVTVFRGTGLPKGQALFVQAATVPGSIGHVIAVHNKHPDADIWTAYQLAPWGMPDDRVLDLLTKDVASLGGEVHAVIKQHSWSYFPHVKTRDLNEKFYDRLDAIQGIRGTYYVGAALNFETVENVAAHAERLVRAHFKKL